MNRTSRTFSYPRQRRTRRHQLEVECLEGRLLPSAVATIREAIGPNAASIQATVQSFRDDIGGNNNGATPGSQGSGRRQIVWDGVPDFDSAGPNNAAGAPTGFMPDDFFRVNGAIFSTPGVRFQVSMDDDNDAGSADLDPDQVEFDNLNGAYDTAFEAFSAEKLFVAIGSNITDVHFVIPGSTTPAVSKGFGAVFTDVDLIGPTRLDFFDRTGAMIFTRSADATEGDASFSFVGVTFASACLARVRITAGTAIPSAVGQSPNDITQGGMDDVVAMDDFIFGEPQPLPNPRIVVGAGPGQAPQVKVFDAATGGVVRSFLAYRDAFRGGVRVATGDISGDGVADIITASGPGPRQKVKIFNGVTNELFTSFFAFGAAYKGGAFVAAGDRNGDERDDIIVGGRGEVKVFSGVSLAQLQSFSAFGTNYTGGVTVAAGDVNGDGRTDIIAGRATGRAHVRAFSGASLDLLSVFPAFDGFTGGVTVATGDVDGNGITDIITGMGPSGGSRVNVFNGAGALIRTHFAFGVNLRGGLNVASTNVSNDELVANIIAAPGEGGPPAVRIVGLPGSQLDSFFAMRSTFVGGVFVAASR